MVVESTAVSPLRSNSSSPDGIGAEVSFMAAASSRVARFHTNSPVASMLATLSFQPTEANPMIGGR